MDPALVFEALQYSVGKTQQEIELAEKYLQQVKYCQGYTQTLILIGCDLKVAFFVRQAALVYLRSSVRELWRKTQGGLSDLDKATLKESLLDGLIKCTESPKLYKQLEDTISYIAETDFPTSWSSFLQDLFARLKNPSDYPNLFGSLLALKSLVKNYKYLQGKDRVPLEYMVDDTFPVLADIVQKALPNAGEQAENTLRVIVKIVYKAIYLLLPKYFLNEEVLNRWLMNIQGILERQPNTPLSQNSSLQMWERYDNSPAWLNKKWCAKILNKILNKYCDINSAKDENKMFPELFLTKYAGHFFESLITVLCSLKGQYIHPKYRFFTLKYIINALSFRQLHGYIANNLETLIYEVIIPSLLLTPQDEEDWVHNPTEYLRREEDYLDLSRNSKLAAESLLEQLSEKNMFNTPEGELILYRLFEYSSHVLLKDIDIRQNKQIDLRVKEAVLYVLGILNTLILSKREYELQMQNLFENFIIPEFGNIQGPLRYRLCWLFGAYPRIQFQKIESLLTLTEGLYGSLCEGELPVRVRAAISLNSVFENQKAHEYIIPFLDKILMSYISLIDTVENERLVKAFSGVIEKFSEHISPYAIDLVKYLTNMFYKTDQESQQSAYVTEIQEKEVVAAGFLSSIVRIFDPNIHPTLIYELEKLLLPTLLYILRDENSNYIALGLKILNKLLLFSEVLTDDIWIFYPLINYLIVGYPEDSNQIAHEKLPEEFKFLEAVKFNGKGEAYVEEITPCLQKYIQKDINDRLFKAYDPQYNLSYLELLILSVEKIYEFCYDSEHDKDMVLITTAYIAIIENHQPLPNEVFTCLLDKVITNIPLVKSIAMEKMLIQIIAVCLWANTIFTLQYLEHKGATEYIFQRWVIRIPDFKHVFEFKRIIIGLSSLLRVDITQLPQVLLNSMKGFLQQLINLTNVVIEMRASRIKTFAINVLPAFRTDEPEVVENNVEEEDDFEYEDDDGLEDYQIADLFDTLEEYSSPLIKTCEVLYFKESLEMLKQNQNAVFIELISTIDSNSIEALQTNFENAAA